MTMLKRFFKITVYSLITLVFLMAIPVIYIETACRSEAIPNDYTSLLPASDKRTEANSYLTYPEWHIVYAYEGLAKTLENGDEHEFDYISSIANFWRSYCVINQAANKHGTADFDIRGTIHIIGISFTAEFGMKALYEETIGRIFALIRGQEKSPQDEYALWMAKDYVDFLLQQPWYQYDFETANQLLWDAPIKDPVRGWERRIGLGGEFVAKAAYAKVIAEAAKSSGETPLEINSVVNGVSESFISSLPDVKIVGKLGDSLIIETPRYRAFTLVAEKIIQMGGGFLEVGGNNDIMLTAISHQKVDPKLIENGTIITQIDRDSFGDHRLLIDTKVNKLRDLIPELRKIGIELEHIHDY